MFDCRSFFCCFSSLCPSFAVWQTWVCRLVIALKIYASMASMNWMFVEGLLLHTKLSGVFTEGPPFACYYTIGWGRYSEQQQSHKSLTFPASTNRRLFSITGLPAVIIILWSSIMSVTLDRESCWKGYGKSPYIWILTIPMFSALIVSIIILLLLFSLIRVFLLNSMDWHIESTRDASTALVSHSYSYPLLWTNVVIIILLFSRCPRV